MTQREVTLDGGVPWGFRMHGGADLKTPLKISRVNPGSKAAQRGIREGDLITSINGASTKNLTNNEAHQLLKKSGSTLKLGLNEEIENSPKKRQYRTIHHETHQETVKRSSVSYTLKEIIERSTPRGTTNNEFEAFKPSEYINGRDTKQNGTGVTVVTNIPISQKSTPSSSSTSTPSTLVPEGKNISSDHALASRQSSYSNCSSIPDEGSQPQIYRETETQEMNDEQERMSKSKKRRQRRQKLLSRSISNESQGKSEVKIDEISQETFTGNVQEDMVLEPTSDKMEVLRLKRIEHKYKVESPKELKIKKPTSIDKKLKMKSKSLDDDDLKIQELSEASESEDTKYQSNVIISEASSEENLLDDADSELQKRRSALDSISLQLNENNQIEATSHISPAEEQALRSFLGSLNLVNSPEESAKDLLERTTGAEDPKVKKLQKRKELEEYFIPIAQNPRFLDAISEEASDISDKECAGSSKSVQHIKQSTPEQESGANNFTNTNADDLAKKIDDERPILVEVKVLEPLLESICSSTLPSTGEEKAEIVYLLDSSPSSRSSDDFEDAIEQTHTQTNNAKAVNDNDKSKDVNMGFHEGLESTQETINETKIDSKNTIKDEEKMESNGNETATNTSDLKLTDFHVESQESMSTVISSNTSTCTKVIQPQNDSPTAASLDENGISVLTQLTPPPSPDCNITKTEENSNSVTTRTLFDYTKIPNVLKGKEPASSSVKEGVGKPFLNKSNPNKEHVISIKNKESVEDKIEASKLGQFDKNDSKSTIIENSEKRSVSAVHSLKKIVNGHLDKMEFRKVKVDEMSKNGDVEVRKDFEEYTNNHLAENKEMNKDEIMRDTPTQITEYDLKDNSKTNDILNEIGSGEEISNDLEVQENNDEGNAKTANYVNESTELIVNVMKDDVENKLESSVSENITSESKKESVLRHVIMTSQDSNKTDSQKLLEFESIRKLNSEIKDKINKQKLIGPIFRKSKSPASNLQNVVENGQETVVLHCEEELPGKNFVQKRIKEFSQQNVNIEEETNFSNSFVTNNIRPVEPSSHSGYEHPPKPCTTLIQSRIKAFYNGFNEDLIEKPECEESVLKRILLIKDTNNDQIKHIQETTKVDENVQDIRANSSKEKNENQTIIETIIPIKVEAQNKIESNIKEGSILKRIILTEDTNNNKLSYSQETTKVHENVQHITAETTNSLKGKNESAKTITIPIKVEIQNKIESNKEEESVLKHIVLTDETNNKKTDYKQTTEEDESARNIAAEASNTSKDEKTESQSIIETIIPIEVETSVLKRLLSEDSFEQGIEQKSNISTLAGQSGHKEIIIPIELEANSEQKSPREHIIPVKVENNLLRSSSISKKTDKIEGETEKSKAVNKERLIPVTIERKGDNKINQESLDGVKASNNKKEHIIPIQNEANLNVSSKVPKHADHFFDCTNKDIQNINKSLKNIIEKSNQNNVDKSAIQITNDNKVKGPMPLQSDTKPGPPVPPPRRSKALLLKQRNEDIQKTDKLSSSRKIDEAMQFTKTQDIVQKNNNKTDIPESNDITYSNVISPPRRASESSDSSSSEESSRCTAKYNPNSSIADVASIAKDDENDVLKKIYEPLPLRDIVLKVLVALPFGEEVLKELAEVSKTIDSLTSILPFKRVDRNDRSNFLVNESNETMPGHWYAQNDIARNSYEDERRNIVELHQKFLARRKYDEWSENPRSAIEDDRDTREAQVMSPNRLLTIIREEPNESEPSNEFLYFDDHSDQRLKAKNLGEWLTLARNKSKSTSNLDSTNIPINNLRRSITSTQNEQAKFSNTRRFSLPQEIYEKQLIDIMEKEREIQRELEKLEEEKRKLRAEMAPSKQKEFQVDDFYVSKKGDFAERRESVGDRKERPASMPVFPTEFFRQQMYEEYMDKFSEREERKQQKVIKISSSNDLEQDKEPNVKSKEIIHPIEIEQEFMDRVKEKFRKHYSDTSDKPSENIEEDDLATPQDTSSDEAPVLVLDGNKVKGVETLPRHLQEFVDDLTTQQDESGPSEIKISQCDKKCCKEARRIYRVLAKNKARKNYSLLHEIDASLTLAKGFLLGRKAKACVLCPLRRLGGIRHIEQPPTNVVAILQAEAWPRPIEIG